MAHPHAEQRTAHVARANKMIGRAGYRNGGSVRDDDAQDRKEIAAAVHKHEKHDHKGEPETKLRSGGHVDGEKGRAHLAKRARGGAMSHKGGKSTKVNVIVAPQGGGAHPVPVPVPVHPPGAGAPPGAAPMGGPPMGGGMAPPGGMPPGGGMPPMMRKRGGKIPHMEAGAMSGPGRIEKMHEYGEGGFKPAKRGVKG